MKFIFETYNHPQQASLEVIEPAKIQLWFAGRQMLPHKKLTDYLGNNDKCKVIIKLVKTGEGQPGREPIIAEETRKQLMLQAYRRQEELKVCFFLIIYYYQFVLICFYIINTYFNVYLLLSK